MDKYLIKKSTFEILGDSEVCEQTPETIPGQAASAQAASAAQAATFTLGVLGSSSAAYWNRDTITDILNPLISDEDKIPTLLNIPTDGTTSILLQIWAERQGVKCAPVDSDWIRLGRRARALRDARIVKESTHLLFFVGTKSDYYEKMAMREAKKGKIVYTIDGKTKELVKWVL